VHYSQVYLHSFYQQRGYQRGIAPVAEAVSKTILTLPLFPAMTSSDVDRVVGSLINAME
jgi:dTDP-4-amino-4,6-dideoxygalactose transaminase